MTTKAAFDGVDRHLKEAARAMGEFGATIMLAYYPRTLPVQIWGSFISNGLEAALPVAIVLLSVALGTLLVVHALRATPWR